MKWFSDTRKRFSDIRNHRKFIISKNDSLISENQFLISEKWFPDIRKWSWFYIRNLCIFWYKKNDFQISEIPIFLYQKVRFSDIRECVLISEVRISDTCIRKYSIYMGHSIKLQLFCHLLLLSNDNEHRKQETETLWVVFYHYSW